MDRNKIIELLAPCFRETPNAVQRLTQASDDHSLRSAEEDTFFLLAHVVNNLVESDDLPTARVDLLTAVDVLMAVHNTLAKLDPANTPSDAEPERVSPELDRISLTKFWEGQQDNNRFWTFFVHEDDNTGHKLPVRMTEDDAKGCTLMMEHFWQDAYNRGEKAGAFKENQKISSVFATVFAPVVDAINNVANKGGI